MLAKMKKSKMENEKFACSNPKCKKEFTDPITVYDFSSANMTTYVGCPYCLTAIDAAVDSDDDEGKQRLEADGNKIDEVKSVITDTDSESNEKPTQQCPKYFGYLSQRSKGEKTPEECMSCPKLVECMLNH
jgi:hypothetical protein